MQHLTYDVIYEIIKRVLDADTYDVCNLVSQEWHRVCRDIISPRLMIYMTAYNFLLGPAHKRLKYTS